MTCCSRRRKRCIVYRRGDGNDIIQNDGGGHDTLRCENVRIVVKTKAAMTSFFTWMVVDKSEL